METFFVQVTQKHIDLALASNAQADPFSCPVARALTDRFGRRQSVVTTRFRDNPKDLDEPLVGGYHPLPQFVTDMVQAFDRNEVVRPTAFMVQV